MQNNTPDIPGAIAAISGAIESMDRHRANLALGIDTVKQVRKELLDVLVAGLLPDISSRTMAFLQKSEPEFAANGQVISAFDNFHKVLGVFEPHGYDQAFVLLQSQLKRHLEQKGAARGQDKEIQKMEAEKASVFSRQVEAMDTLHLLEKAQSTNTQIPKDAVAAINRMAARTNHPGGNGFDYRRTGSNRLDVKQNANTSASESDDSDLWLWAATDIPINYRTLILDALAHDHHSTGMVSGNGDFGGAGASGDFASPAAAHNTDIATDDRLGVFS